MTHTIVVCGTRNSGKTTWVCALTEALSARGLRVGTIKHTHHDCRPPGKDSTRHQAAGATRVLLVAADCQIRYDESAEPELEELVAREFGEFDVVLVEGYRQSHLPKVIVGDDPNADETHVILRLPPRSTPPGAAETSAACSTVVDFLAT